MKISYKNRKALENHTKRWEPFHHFLVFLMRSMICHREGTQVSFAESNAAIYANSIGKLKTNKESAFSALASAITGKSPYSDLRKDDSPTMSIAMKVSEPNELTFGLLGYFAGKVADKSVAISGVKNMDKRCNKSYVCQYGNIRIMW